MPKHYKKGNSPKKRERQEGVVKGAGVKIKINPKGLLKDVEARRKKMQKEMDKLK
jgi:hypothetical protein